MFVSRENAGKYLATKTCSQKVSVLIYKLQDSMFYLFDFIFLYFEVIRLNFRSLCCCSLESDMLMKDLLVVRLSGS